jgi:hypothetical protein
LFILDLDLFILVLIHLENGEYIITEKVDQIVQNWPIPFTFRVQCPTRDVIKLGLWWGVAGVEGDEPLVPFRVLQEKRHQVSELKNEVAELKTEAAGLKGQVDSLDKKITKMINCQAS